MFIHSNLLMKLSVNFVDAFTSELFKGNSAAVILLDQWLPESVMQSIAIENNLSETAFLVRDEERFLIRWFSPIKEVDFCGHATLASAFVLFSRHKEKSQITFWAQAVGSIAVLLKEGGLIEMNWPKQEPFGIDTVPTDLLDGLSIKPKEVLRNRQAYFAVYENEQQIRSIVPNSQALKGLAPYDVVVTAPGETYDFVSRYFWPANGGEEDPVTGSIHSGLAPFWAQRLEKSELVAMQVSARTGLLNCRVESQRVYISGMCIQYLEGVINI
jgi:PhzF family phenazine biosynthesis protein